MLHLVFDLQNAIVLERLHNQAGVIFLNNAVFKLLKNSLFQIIITDLSMTTPCYVLNEDLILRGIENDLILENITPIDYTQFVKLTLEHTPIQTWN